MIRQNAFLLIYLNYLPILTRKQVVLVLVLVSVFWSLHFARQEFWFPNLKSWLVITETSLTEDT